MSVPVNGVVRRNGGGRLPDGTEVASYGSYEEALAALEVLASNDFEVEQVSVVGTDLYSVERIMGRVTWARAVSSAVMNGALWGAMIGIVLSINQGNTMVWVGACMLAGAFMTACLSTSLFFMRRRRRDFYSQSQVVAGRYAVIIAKAAGVDRIREAFELLQKTQGNQMRPRRARTPRESSGPTEYGSRPDEQPRFGVRLSQAADTPQEQAQPTASSDHSKAEGAPSDSSEEAPRPDSQD
ncbi:general stress protein [Actinomyces sp. S6-Spd3]|uniref:general stress protein n=1 Tax=Actinomyces sp. S6-Spd3 TaxID=1284680 RepID=UPI0009DCE1A7|nr:general stress protein [Actinomyces sp. S6-Spd3]